MTNIEQSLLDLIQEFGCTMPLRFTFDGTRAQINDVYVETNDDDTESWITVDLYMHHGSLSYKLKENK